MRIFAMYGYPLWVPVKYDINCAEDFGENTGEVIKRSLESEMENELEPDGVIKKGWKVTLIKNEKKS